MSRRADCSECSFYVAALTGEWPVPAHCTYPLPIWTSSLDITKELRVIDHPEGAIACKAYKSRIAYRGGE